MALRTTLVDDGPLLSAILDIAHDAIIVVDENHRVMRFNRGAEAVFGYPSAEVVGQPLETLLPCFPPERWPASSAPAATAEAPARGMVDRMETSGTRKDGTRVHVEVNMTRLYHRTQPVFAVILRDVSDRKQIQSDLETTEARHRHALDSMLEGCQIIGFDWRYLYVNEAVSNQGRRARDELLGRTMMEAYPGIEDTAMFDVLRRAMDERTSHRLVNEFTYPDGTIGVFELSVQPVPEGIFILSNDITEREKAKGRLETQLQRMAALHSIDIAIAGSLDLRLSLNVVLSQTTVHLGVDAACVLLLDAHTQTLDYTAGCGFRTRAMEQSRMRVDEGFSGSTVMERRVRHVHDPARSSEFPRAVLLAEEDVVEYYGAPLVAKGRVVGVLEVFLRSPHDADDEWLSFLETLAGQTAIAVDNAQLFENLQRSNVELSLAYDATIEGWSRALDLRDRETEGHTRRVTEMTERLARAAGIDGPELSHIRRGALLHDIGKMGVPDSILLKPGPLSDAEWDVMRLHPTFAFDLLAPIAFLRPALDIPYCHHEKWDGTGYPRGLERHQIPLSARLFAAVDIWDALCSDRPYRSAWPEARALEYIRSLSGTHLDPRAVDLFLRIIDEKRQPSQ